MGNKMMLATVLSWGLISVGFTYIVSDWKQPVCPFVKCQNDGVLDRTTCRCNCPPGYFGYFCEKVKLRTKWPDGTYALPASMFGCPETEDRDWTLSYINLTLPDSAQRQYWNTKDPDLLNGIIEPNILGPYYYRAIQMNFCVKNLAYFDDENNDTTKEWPKGEYCIYNLNECPQGFSNGSLTISGYQFTHQDIGGVIPGETGSNMSLMLKFCCREDGDYRTSIKLPSEFPFVLFQSMSADGCQEVTSMITQRDYFYMTNEHDDWQFEGTLPMFNRTAINGSIGVAYCYYKPYDHRECYYDTDHGNSYNGRKSVSASGKACLIWTDSDFDFFHNDKRTYHEFDENYCRAYEYFTYKSRKPLCLVEFPNVKEECNVPICAEDKGLQEFGKFKPFKSVPNAGDNYPDYPVDGFIGTMNSFVSNRPMMKPWYQIDLQEYVEVHAIIIYRYATYFPNNMRYVGTYISKNQWDFINYGAVRCDEIRLPGYSRVFRYQCRRPVVGQYVTIRNFDFTHPDINPGNYFKMEINEITILGKSTTCGRALGMASGNIYDYQLESSSYDTESVEVMPLSFRGRLYHPDPGWCASKKDEQPWFMIDLIIPTVIQGVIIQGWISGIYTRYIQSFQVSYGVTRNTMTRYRASPGTVKTFVTDTTIEVSTPQTFLFHTDILARYIKIHPIVKDSQQACFKTEVIGCQKQLQRDIKCKRDTIDFGYEELKRFSYWLEKEDNSPFDAKNISSIKGCRQFCLRNNCTALSFQKYTSSQRCSLSFGDRYHPTRTVAWVQTGSTQHYASHRLCFKHAHPILPCIFPINLQQRKEAVIRSPGFPFSYGQGLNCTWNIFAGDLYFVTLEIVYLHLAKPTTKIALKELGIFDINPGKCKESLLITEQSNTIEISTDTERDYRDTTVISSGKILSVRLKSCFQMSAEKREKNFEIKVTKSGKPGCGMTEEGCTVTCTLQSAYIATKRYPAPYKAEETCTWRIEGTFGQYVDLKILHLDVINGDATCSNSYIAVYDIDLSESEVLLGRFCKENRPYRNITSRWHRMRIEFHSGNGEKQGQGFLGLYTFVNFTQRYLDMENGECSSNWYYNNGSCYKIFTGNEGITWQKAEQKCIQQNGSLVSINSKQELSFIHFLLTNAMNITRDWEIYIGLRKIYSEENDELNYMWTDENPLTFTAWFRGDNIKDGQPNGVHNELCTSIRFSSIHSIHDWHDTACAYNKIKSYLCEIEIVKQNETILRENWWGIGSLESQSSARLDNILLKCENTELINRLFVCDGMEDCFDGSDESNCSTTCTETQFQCSSGDCVSISLYCDFVSHCPDNSDETNCIRRPCTDKEWECYSGQCIPAVNRCDMKVDCVDGSDEDYCVNCNNGFECYDQTCLHLSKVCDGFIDCSGFFAEDESQNCENNVRRSCKDWWRLGKRENGEYFVNMGLIGISPSKVECQFVKANDHVSVRTVIHHSEEETLYTRLTEVDITLKYNANQAQIAKLKEMNNCSQKVRVRCHYIYVNIDVMLEGQNGHRLHTRSGDQQSNCSCPFVNKCEKGKTKCNCNSTLGEWYGAEATEVREDAGIITNHSFLPIKRVFIHCPGENKFIKLNIGPLECSEETDNVNIDFLCRTGKIVPISRRCILDYDVYGDIIGCRDLSHLDECETIACPSGYMKCPGSFCIPPRLICDGEKHCKNGVDEMHCESCPGLYRCKDSTVCLNPNKLCDNITHCPLGDDELLCFITCPDKCQCDGLSSICRDIQNKSIIKLPSQLRYLDLSENNFSNGLPSLKHLKDLIRLFMADCGLTSIESFTFINQRNLLKLDLRNNKITQLHSNAFTGLVSLKDLQMEGNELLTEIADQAFLGLQSLPEMTLTNSRLWNIQRNTLVGLQNVRQLNLSANRIRFISDFAFQNLSNVIVLDMQRNEVKQFSSQIFNGLLKLQKLYTDSYAFCCLKPTSVKECLPTADEFSSCDDLMRNDILSTFMWITGFCSLFGNLGVFIFKVRFDSHTLKKSHGIFITNLSVSDFLMGIYLIIIASADQYYRGKYIWNDVRWRESTACQIAGMLATISSEMSVFLLCLITIDRLIAVKFPFGQLRFSRTRALYCIGILWSATVLLSAIPLIPGRYFKQKFYSRSVVCLALPLTRDRPAGWEYSTAIFIILNFILFLIIALGQCLIFREISNTSSKVNSTRRTHEMVIARGLFLIVLSDCLCWCPIGIMGRQKLVTIPLIFFHSCVILHLLDQLTVHYICCLNLLILGLLALNGHVISGEVYTWVAVFILPINSALNPFLYSFSSIRSRVRKIVFKDLRKRTEFFL